MEHEGSELHTNNIYGTCVASLNSEHPPQVSRIYLPIQVPEVLNWMKTCPSDLFKCRSKFVSIEYYELKLSNIAWFLWKKYDPHNLPFSIDSTKIKILFLSVIRNQKNK